jgi:hypothetical protein
MSKSLIASTVLASALCAAGAASAATDFSFTGSFTGDADVQLLGFTIGATSDVTLRSYSYAGGTMADGTSVPAGGFDPILALWDAAGDLIGQFDDGPGPVPSDPTTDGEYDANLILTGLMPGSYTASIAQYANFAAGTTLSEGFTQTDATFTAAFGCSNGRFCDFTGDNRTSFWAFDVLGVDTATAAPPAPVPVPAGLPLALTAMAAFGLVARRRRDG